MSKNCSACNDLRTNAPDFTANGVTYNVCTSLKNNTGFNPASGNDNCDDLSDANECLIRNMEDIIPAYDVCDWQKFMAEYVPNDATMNEAIICALCGMQEYIDKLQCYINFLFKGHSFRFSETTDETTSHVVAGKGISYLVSTSSTAHAADVTLLYIAGGLVRGSGSCNFYSENFTDAESCLNYDDDGVNPKKSKNRKGNDQWTVTGNMANGGELLYEIRIKNSEYPEIKSLWAGLGQSTGGGGYQVVSNVFNEGDWAYGQHGWCDDEGHPDGEGYSPGHKVPSGWTYVQVRMRYIMQLTATGKKYTPRHWMGIRFNKEAIDC